MEPFHAFMTLTCKTCDAPLLRIGLSESRDIVVCPVCMKTGGYDDVLEEGGELEAGYPLTADTKSLVARAWAERSRAG